ACLYASSRRLGPTNADFKSTRAGSIIPPEPLPPGIGNGIIQSTRWGGAMQALSIVALFLGFTCTMFVLLLGIADYVDPLVGLKIH
ncbi:hypothetical protein, partial [Microvirga zambiensis]|uniref:hypothetical protein n=1 Tax=Microvirga zambiensis TaxID=1402137 RepID=UPI001AEF7287